MGRRRYRSMGYVYKRSSGIYEIRYPIPADVQPNFPQPNGSGLRSHIILSLGTRDQVEANRLSRQKTIEIEGKFSTLRDVVKSEHFAAFCKYVFEKEVGEDAERRLDGARPRHLDDRELPYLRELLDDRSIESMEAHVGWVVDHYLENAAEVSVAVSRDSELRVALLNAAADVMWDVYRRISATATNSSYTPTPTALQLQTRPEPVVVPGDNTPLSKEGRTSLGKYWEVHEKVKQGSSSPVKPHTLSRRKTAWTEFCQLLGKDKPIFKIKKSDVWTYHDALQAAPARAGSIKALRALTFPQRVEAMKSAPEKYDRLDLNTVGDRLRQINAVFELAVKRGHLSENPASGVSAAKVISAPYRDPYNIDELQLIFSSAPYYDKLCPLEQQTDEYWVPLMELFLGARASELYVRTTDVDLDHEIPHIKLVEYAERTLKNAASARLLPIHPMLIELGFLDYCRHAKLFREELFPQWKFREDQKPSEGPNRRRFNRHLKTLMPARKFPADSHTFRHNFETALSAAKNVPPRVELRLSGRAVVGSAGGYVHDLPLLPDLAETIAKIQYRGLSLNHLMLS